MITELHSTEQHEPKGRMLFCLEVITYLLDVIPTHCHTHYHLHPFHFVLFKFEGLVAKQHPTNKSTEVTAIVVVQSSRSEPLEFSTNKQSSSSAKFCGIFCMTLLKAPLLKRTQVRVNSLSMYSNLVGKAWGLDLPNWAKIWVSEIFQF